jgi:hypothetical protein
MEEVLMVNTMLLSLMVTASGIFETGKDYTNRVYDFSKPYVVQAYKVSKPYAKWLAVAVVLPCAYKAYKYFTKKTIKPVVSRLSEPTYVEPTKVEPTKVEPTADKAETVADKVETTDTTSTYTTEIQNLLTKIEQGERNIVVSDELKSQMPLPCQRRIEHAMMFLQKDNERTQEAGLRKLEHTLRLCLKS